jgi:hypothetical protein
MRTKDGTEVKMLGQITLYRSCLPFKQCRSHIPQTADLDSTSVHNPLASQMDFGPQEE